MAMCGSWRFWAVLGAATLGVALVALGGWARVVPVAAFAACPLSMLVMGVGMAHTSRHREDEITDAPADPRYEVVR